MIDNSTRKIKKTEFPRVPRLLQHMITVLLIKDFKVPDIEQEKI